MLRELAKLSGGMLFMHGHVTDLETARRLAHGCTVQIVEPAPQEGPKPSLFGAAEWLMLAPIWIVTPMIVLLAAAELVRAA